MMVRSARFLSIRRSRRELWSPSPSPSFYREERDLIYNIIPPSTLHISHLLASLYMHSFLYYSVICSGIVSFLCAIIGERTLWELYQPYPLVEPATFHSLLTSEWLRESGTTSTGEQASRQAHALSCLQPCGTGSASSIAATPTSFHGM